MRGKGFSDWVRYVACDREAGNLLLGHCQFYKDVRSDEYPSFKLSGTLLVLLNDDSRKKAS